MRLKIIAFTEKGAVLCKAMAGLCQLEGCSCTGYAMQKYAEPYGLLPVTSLADWTKQCFADKAAGLCDGILFVGASGIAVRSIAPCLVSKEKDPAVLSIDEQGRFVVSLVAGHIGGANDLAAWLAGLIGATPVISTATDINNCFAVDSWAVKNEMLVKDMARIKTISGALLAGQTVGVCSDFPIIGGLPEHVELQQQGEIGFSISYDERKQPFTQTLRLIPKRLHVGIGCRKGTAKEQIMAAVAAVCQANHISLAAIRKLASIDLKEQEPGLLAFCLELRLEKQFYSAGELQQMEGGYTASAFVSSITGVDNVCERAAVKSSNGALLIKKQIVHSVTVAVAEAPWEVRFGY